MIMQIDLTQEEMIFIANMFKGASVSILDPNTTQTATMAQGIVAKFQAALIPSIPEATTVNQSNLNVTGDNVGAQIGA
jgi:hypothetical protein